MLTPLAEDAAIRKDVVDVYGTRAVCAFEHGKVLKRWLISSYEIASWTFFVEPGRGTSPEGLVPVRIPTEAAILRPIDTGNASQSDSCPRLRRRTLNP